MSSSRNRVRGKIGLVRHGLIAIAISTLPFVVACNGSESATVSAKTRESVEANGTVVLVQRSETFLEFLDEAVAVFTLPLLQFLNGLPHPIVFNQQPCQ